MTSRDLRLLYWGSYEGVLFDGREMRHPAALPGMRDRTVTVGDVLVEQRMIAWRIGWVVAPGDLVDDVARVQIYSGLLASGFAQIGARVALEQPPDGLAAANAEWQRRRDETIRQLDGLPAVPAAGGWSLLLDVAALGLDCARGVAIACSSRRSRRRRCAAGAARSPTVTSASCSATSRWNGWPCSATGSAGPSPSRASSSWSRPGQRLISSGSGAGCRSSEGPGVARRGRRRRRSRRC